MDFKGTKGNFKEDLGIDLLGHNDELMQIIVFSKEVNTHSVAHVFGLSQEEVMANAKLFANSKKCLNYYKDLFLKICFLFMGKSWQKIWLSVFWNNYC